MRKLIKKAMLVLLMSTMIFQLSYVKSAATGSYQEENVDSTNKNSVDAGMMQVTYDENNKLNYTYLKEDEINYIKQITYNKNNKTIRQLYKGKKYLSTKSITMFGNLKYVFTQNQKKQNITITVYNKKMKKQASSTFSMKGWIDKKDKTILNGYVVICQGMNVINKNKVQIMYSIYIGSGKFKGGVAVLDLKKQKVIKTTYLDFCPLRCDDTYIYGRKDSLNDIYCIAKRKNGKVLKTYDAGYGMDSNTSELVSGIIEGDRRYFFCCDYKDGQIVIMNYSGVYYGSVDTEGVEKIADLSELPYYTANYQNADFLRVALKNKSEFSVVYGDSFEYANWVIKK